MFNILGKGIMGGFRSVRYVKNAAVEVATYTVCLGAGVVIVAALYAAPILLKRD